MAKLTSKDGTHTIETEVPREIAQLRAEGYREAASKKGGSTSGTQGGSKDTQGDKGGDGK